MVAQLDDRDFAQVLPRLHLHGAPVGDEALLAWLDDPAAPLTLVDGDRQRPIERVASDQLERRFGFIGMPAALT